MNNLIAIGPWYVVAPLAQCFASDGTQTHLSLRGGSAHWVGGGEKWQAWSGKEHEAREYAALHGGEAAPAKLVDARHIRRDWREDPRHHSTHAHDRTWEITIQRWHRRPSGWPAAPCSILTESPTNTENMKSESTTEAEMRAEKAPWPDTLEVLNEYITSLVERKHGYGTCVYAMSLAATAAFYHVSSKLGVTGFQASCADLDFLRRTRSMDGPFIILKAEDMLYPQYDLPEKLREAMESWKEWAAEECAKKLEKSGEQAHPDVKAHWERLASHNDKLTPLPPGSAGGAERKHGN